VRVAPINDSHSNRRVAQGPCRLESSEASSDNHHMRHVLPALCQRYCLYSAVFCRFFIFSLPFLVPRWSFASSASLKPLGDGLYPCDSVE